MKENQTYSISELSQEFDITTRTVRFYEEKGLLAPKREGNARIYSSADRITLKLILRGKRLGFTLDESRDIISMYNPTQDNMSQLQSLIKKIREKRTQLTQQLHDIELMMHDLRDSEEKCLVAMANSNEIPSAMSKPS